MYMESEGKDNLRRKISGKIGGKTFIVWHAEMVLIELHKISCNFQIIIQLGCIYLAPFRLFTP